MLIYKKLYASWYEGDERGNNKVLGGEEDQKLKIRHVRL